MTSDLELLYENTPASITSLCRVWGCGVDSVRATFTFGAYMMLPSNANLQIKNELKFLADLAHSMWKTDFDSTQNQNSAGLSPVSK